MSKHPLVRSQLEFDFTNNSKQKDEEKITNFSLSQNSLLRYPGGKTRAIKSLIKYFPAELKEMCSPFFGGGSIEIYLAARGVKVLGYDIFTPLVEFWQCTLEDPNKLADQVEKFYPLSKDLFYDFQSRQSEFKKKIERAAIYYILNRSSFSGSTLSGGMSPGHPRFTLTAIERLRAFHNSNFTVEHLDFSRSLESTNNMFAYLDPPYLIKNSLYGKKGDAHKYFDHSALCEILKHRSNWVLSYNDCEEVRNMYAAYEIVKPNWSYGMSNDKSSKEVVILSPK